MKNKTGFNIIKPLIIMGIIGFLATFSFVALSNSQKDNIDCKQSNNLDYNYEHSHIGGTYTFKHCLSDI